MVVLEELGLVCLPFPGLLATISGTTPASVTVFGMSFPFCSDIHFTYIQYIYLGCFIRFIGVLGDDRKGTKA